MAMSACASIPGHGRSPGYIATSLQGDPRFLPLYRMGRDSALEHGKVGLSGISYYPSTSGMCFSAASSSCAMIPWEGRRTVPRHDLSWRILCTFWANWYDQQVMTVQYGLGSGVMSIRIQESSLRPRDSLGQQLAKNGRIWCGDQGSSVDDQYHQERSPAWFKITVPLLSSANWEARASIPGNFEGFVRSASKQKWLEVHALNIGRNSTPATASHCRNVLRPILERLDNDWKRQPRVQLQVRKIDGFVQRAERNGLWPDRWTSSTSTVGLQPRRNLSRSGKGEFEALVTGYLHDASARKRPKSPDPWLQSCSSPRPQWTRPLSRLPDLRS